MILQSANAGDLESRSFISAILFSCSVATILQSLTGRGIGSGYLCPNSCEASYIPASLAAVSLGGLLMVSGMILLSSFFEMALSRSISRLRQIFTPELIWLAVIMVGVTLIPVASRSFVGLDSSSIDINPAAIPTAAATLGIMVVSNVWGKENLRLFSALIGISAGYVLSYLTGILMPEQMPDTNNLSRGMLSGGIGVTIGSLAGGMGQSTSTANVGLALGTGATSRKIAYVADMMLIGFSFFTRLAGIFLIMPRPVMGAALIFSVSFTLLTGFQIMMSRMIDSRKIFMIGIAIIFGLSINTMSDVYALIHDPWIKPILSAPLSLATILAISMAILFRIGIAKQYQLVIKPGTDASDSILWNQSPSKL